MNLTPVRTRWRRPVVGRAVQTLAVSMLTWLFSQFSFAQENALNIDRLTVDQGLSQSDVKCMVQDSLGFLWIGTRDGLNRFDGYSFKTFPFDNSDVTALAFNQIHALNLLKNGNIIIGSVGGVSMYDYRRHRFSNHYFDKDRANAVVHDIAVSGDDAILATTNGLIRFDTQSETFHPNDDDELSRAHATQVKLSSTGSEWIGTSTGLLMRSSEDQPLKVILPDVYVYHVNPEKGTVLVSTSRGLFEFTLEGTLLRPIALPSGPSTVTYTLRASNGELWVASDKVIVLSRDLSEIKHILRHDQGNNRTLSEDRVRVLYETRDRTVWLGTFGYGLNKHNPQTRKITTLTDHSTPALSSNYVSAIYSADDTTLFVGTSRGLNIVDYRNNTVSVYNPKPPGVRDDLFLVYAIKRGREGDLWMTATGGVYRWQDDSFVREHQGPNEIVDFVDLDSASLLLVTRVKGCYLYDKATRKVSVFAAPSCFAGDLSTVAICNDEIWLGALDGLRCYDRNANLLHHFTADAADSTALSSNTIKGLFVDSQENLWIGTWGGGLSRYQPQSKTFETLTTQDGLPNNVVYGLVEDSKGILWMSTNHGLSAYDPRKKSFSNFDVSDGLQSNEFNTGAYFKSANGVAYFGGVGGLNTFSLESLYTSPVVADVFLADIEGSNTADNADEIPLSWRDDVALHFAAIDFNSAHKYRFEYSLNGQPWRSLGSSRRLDLPELAGGEYDIRMRASTNGRAWTEGNTLAKLDVTGPFWRHPLSYAMLIAALGMIAFVAYRFRLTTLKRMNVLLNTIVDERTREVQLKNEEILSQNEQLVNRAIELTLKNSQLEQTRTELQAFQSELEQRVNERTHDIQVLNEELLHQNAQLEQFSFITAHNFRGPVARIKGLIDLLEREPVSSGESLRILDYLSVSVSDLDDVIGDLNELLHIKERGKGAFSRVDVHAVMTKVLSELAPEIELSGVTVDASRFERHDLSGIDAFFHSIFYNLTENALKYTRPDIDPVLTISCLRRDETVMIEFSDNGAGIDLTMVMSKIFKIYQRFSLGGEGRGLGLYLVKTQTEMMGGEIAVRSTVGHGTTFILSFRAAG